ncbi:DeoR/GlpR family DNA-binding transcription regulator [Paenibacillus sp. OK003]|uniref:DeoR/GlpR family DNA-binding transcription regulator n=1 Tax=Paenibacillus sp. OK003 TaxID=1884380 RepID=UPI0008BD9684|nr:DeoR/GlpR family DNA-binding transcription regulator [Paenibacillus sp. OK003]SEL88729.1 transcriptional regulator, DeoR family [Paenibacillus sp. OK003]
MSLTYEERRHTILNQLATQGKVQVQVLADLFQVSTETIRRDLDRLEKEGELRKVYGGAVRVRSGMIEAPFQKRAQLQLNEKQAIGVAAASLIEDGETIMLDNGTTTLEIMRQLRHRSQVTVITNSVPILTCALEEFAGKIIFAGGEVTPVVQASTGPIAHELLSQFKVNKAFISAGGVSLTDGITDYVLEEALISRKMMERAEEAILVADHTKFGRSTFAQIAPINQISMVITDSGCPTEWIDALHQMEIDMVHSI